MLPRPQGRQGRVMYPAMGSMTRFAVNHSMPHFIDTSSTICEYRSCHSGDDENGGGDSADGDEGSDDDAGDIVESLQLSRG